MQYIGGSTADDEYTAFYYPVLKGGLMTASAVLAGWRACRRDAAGVTMHMMGETALRVALRGYGDPCLGVNWH